jgi:hypothetical protein
VLAPLSQAGWPPTKPTPRLSDDLLGRQRLKKETIGVAIGTLI